MQIVIRSDGGAKIGYGHLIRSSALVEELLARSSMVTVATATPEPAETVFPDSVDIVNLPSRGDPEPFVKWLDEETSDLVFTDTYSVDTEYQRAIRNKVPLAVMQDNDRHDVCADLFVNGNLYATDLDYEFVGEEPQMCLGSDYVLLRREIRDRANDDPPWREQPERALITMGGSDIADLTPTVVRAFEGFDLQVDAIVGPGFSETQEHSIYAAAEEVSAKVSIERDPPDLVDRMFQADFAISTSSSTIYELLALGTPIISVPVADNQELIAMSLRERGAARVLEREGDTKEFKHSIEAYFSKPELRRRFRYIGQQLVDGCGTERICTEILSIAEDNRDI